jgi:dCMP deaminase
MKNTLRKKMKRPDWDEYFMNIAEVAATRSNCSRRHVASIIVKDKRIISTGYNGTPRGVKNCDDGGCPRCASDTPSGEKLTECICSHGEENAIVQAAYHGISVKDASIYSTYSPCLLCAKMIINAGIKEVIYRKNYHMEELTSKLFNCVGIKVRQIS